MALASGIESCLASGTVAQSSVSFLVKAGPTHAAQQSALLILLNKREIMVSQGGMALVAGIVSLAGRTIQGQHIDRQMVVPAPPFTVQVQPSNLSRFLHPLPTFIMTQKKR